MKKMQVSAVFLLVAVCLGGSKAESEPVTEGTNDSGDPIQSDFDLWEVVGMVWYEMYRTAGSPFQGKFSTDATYLWTPAMSNRAMKQEYREFLPRNRRWNDLVHYTFPGERGGEFILVVDNQAYTMTVLWSDNQILVYYWRATGVYSQPYTVVWVLSRNSTMTNAQAGQAFDVIQEKLGIHPTSLRKIDHGIADRILNGADNWNRPFSGGLSPVFPLPQRNTWPLSSNSFAPFSNQQMIRNPMQMGQQLPTSIQLGQQIPNSIQMGPQMMSNPVEMPQQMMGSPMQMDQQLPSVLQLGQQMPSVMQMGPRMGNPLQMPQVADWQSNWPFSFGRNQASNH